MNRISKRLKEPGVLELTKSNVFNPVVLLGLTEDERSSIKVSRRSFYVDNVWDFIEDNPYLSTRSSVINFSNIQFENGTRLTCVANQNYLSAVKEYIYSLVVNPPSTRPTISSIATSVRKGLKHLLQYMQRSGIRRFSELTEVDMRSMILSIAEKPNGSGSVLTDRTLRARTYGLSWLYEQSRSKKISDGLTVWPYGDCKSASEWAKSNAHRILDRRIFTTPDMPDSVAMQLIQKAVEDIKLSGLVEEVRRAQLSHKTIGRKMVVNTSHGKVLCDTRQFPWHKYGLASHWDLYALERRVQASGYILIALLTGMRFHEVVNIRKDNSWLDKIVKVGACDIKFNFVVSTTTKLEGSPLRVEWQTVPFIEQVLDALKQCSRHSSTEHNPWLFSSRENGKRLGSSTIHSRLNEFAKLHNIHFNERPWALATHQFRKKHARIMIRQGLGILWLKDQLKHWDVEMTKGYGDLSLYTELQQEKFTLSSEKYAELVGSQLPIIGGGAEDLGQMRKVFSGMIASEREVFLNDLPRKALIEQTDDGLCMYRPSKAMCGGDRNNCRPADCNNSLIPAVSLRQTLKWRLSENARLKKFFVRDAHKVAHLDSRIGELTKLLQQIDSVGGT